MMTANPDKPNTIAQTASQRTNGVVVTEEIAPRANAIPAVNAVEKRTAYDKSKTIQHTDVATPGKPLAMYFRVIDIGTIVMPLKLLETIASFIEIGITMSQGASKTKNNHCGIVELFEDAL